MNSRVILASLIFFSYATHCMENKIVDAGKQVYQLLDAIEEGDETKVASLLTTEEIVAIASREVFIPLHWASRGSNAKILVLLIKHYQINLQDRNGLTPLHWASDSPVATKVLLEHGANVTIPNNQGLFALHRAACTGNTETIKLLLDHECLVNIRDSNGFTPLHYAALNGKDEAIHVLIQRGANVNACDNSQELTPLHLVFKREDLSAQPKTVTNLISHGALINVRDGKGRIPLHYAVKCYPLNSAKILLEHKAHINALDDEGRTPLDHARDYPMMIHFLEQEKQKQLSL